ncbi:hypothetical protein D9M71_455560 [compost metagenome]
MAEGVDQRIERRSITQATEAAGGAQTHLPVIVAQGVDQGRAGVEVADLAQGGGGFFADLPGSVAQGLAQGRQHLRVRRQAQRPGGGTPNFSVRVSAGQPRQGRQGIELLEPAEHAHRLAAHAGAFIVQCSGSRRGGIGATQLAQRPECGNAYAAVGVPGPRQNDPARRFTLEQAKALRCGRLHRRGWIRQRLAQRLDYGLVLPGFQQPRGFGANVCNRVFGQPIDQPLQAIRLLEIGQFDQRDPAYAGVVIGQARLQGKNVVVIGYIE